MFVGCDAELGVPFVTARPRLMDLVAGGALAGASRAAYDEGLASLGQAGVPGDLAGPAGLIRVRSLPPAHGPGRVSAGLRWEAVGAPDRPFPVLDADLTLAPAGLQATRLSLAGVYRPPFGYLNHDLDPAATGRVANVTVSALLRAIAAYLAGSGPGGPAGRSPRPADAVTDPPAS